MKSNLLIFFTILLICSAISQPKWEDNDNKKEIEKINWLSGYWTANTNDIKMEELWLPESNGKMIGIHRDSFSSGKVFYEYLSIEQKNDTVIYSARPGGNEPTEFRMIFCNDSTTIFENPYHDYPQKIIYSLTADTLTARIEGTLKGNFNFSEWHWKKSNLK